MAGNEPSISTTMKVNNNGGPQESRVNAVSLWCHVIPEKTFQIIDKLFLYQFNARTSKLSLK